MSYSRREFLRRAGGTAALASIPIAASTAIAGPAVTPDQIIDLFEPLPGEKGVKIFVPAVPFKPAFLAELNVGKKLFVASANKTFGLCQALRQVEHVEPGKVIETLETTKLKLNSSIWSLPGSPVFNPPHLEGEVSERVALEAMIMNSDNTATDMIFKEAGVDNIRSFIAAQGFTQTLIPDSTRAFSGYLFGAPNYLTLTWEELLNALENGVLSHPFLNNVETFASSASDLVDYYSRALQGAFFKRAETLNEFRRILTLCDFIYLIPLPLGVSAYAKSGNVDFPETQHFPGFHVRSIAGGLFTGKAWIYFAFVINWDNRNATDEATVDQYYAAINQALTLVKNAYS